FFVFVLTAFMACSDDDSTEKDDIKPTITVNYNEGFPQTCVKLVRGETYHFRAMATDNLALAAYSLDLHHNFDHHTHDDQGTTCVLGSKKDPVNPLIYMENFSIAG